MATDLFTATESGYPVFELYSIFIYFKIVAIYSAFGYFLLLHAFCMNGCLETL